MRCIHCGEEISSKDKQCPACGAEIVINKENVKKKSKKKKRILIMAIVVLIAIPVFIGVYHLTKVATVNKYMPMAEEYMAQEQYEKAVNCYLKILRPFRNVPEAQEGLAEALVLAYEKDEGFEDELFKGASRVYNRYDTYLGEYGPSVLKKLEELEAEGKGRIGEFSE